ncbi:unnamed protein product [Sphenostylis stenocarpa]|uniref:GINS subunit domain-containing protein n=1 Tax=Sphenostylis stenocarpa TaxID=92480 RepID=A0AA86SCC9_9FABA|nr:unnamed protein product [Sphenostylis stenocarpa]
MATKFSKSQNFQGKLTLVFFPKIKHLPFFIFILITSLLPSFILISLRRSPISYPTHSLNNPNPHSPITLFAVHSVSPFRRHDLLRHSSVYSFDELKRKYRSSRQKDRMAKYYDIDDIIMEEETVSVIFQKAASGVGIDPSSEMDFIETGSKVELPFWLAHELQLRQAVSVNVPSCFDQKTRLEIQADSAGVDLRSRCPFFYDFGCKIAPIVGDRTIGFLLLSAFKSRYKEILTKAHSVAFAAGSKFWTILTKEEINLYETAQSAMASFKKWRMGGPRFQIAAVLGRKRKSTE